MQLPLKLTFLGTGSVKGCPVYGCHCPACIRAAMDPLRARRPASVQLEWDGQRYLLDAGLTDLEERFAPGSLSAILLTHYHMDHVAGLFSLRWGENMSIPVLGPNDPEPVADLLKHPGILDFSRQLRAFETITLGAAEITPVPLQHSRPTLGYSIRYQDNHVAYLTDTLGLPEASIQWLKQHRPDDMIIDCSYPPGLTKSGSHNDLEDVISLHQQIKPKRTLLTHIGHQLDDWLEQPGHQLPAGIELANDGMVIVY